MSMVTSDTDPVRTTPCTLLIETDQAPALPVQVPVTFADVTEHEVKSIDCGGYVIVNDPRSSVRPVGTTARTATVLGTPMLMATGVGVGVRVAVTVGEAATAAVAVRVGEVVHVGVIVRVRVTVTVGVIVDVVVIDRVGLIVWVGQTSGVTVTVGVVVRVAVIVGVGEIVGVALRVAVGVRVPVGNGVTVRVGVGVRVAVTLRVAVTVFVGVIVKVGVIVRVTDRVGMMVGVGTRVAVRGTTVDAIAATSTATGSAPSAGHIPRCPEANALDACLPGIHVSAKISSTTDPKNHLRMQITIDHAVVSGPTGLKALASFTVDPLVVRDHAGLGKDRSGLNRAAGANPPDPPSPAMPCHRSHAS